MGRTEEGGRRLRGGMMAILLAIAVAGCPAGSARRIPRQTTPPPPEAVREPIEPPRLPSPEPPSEADLAVKAAREAAERGDDEAAVEFYGWAESAGGSARVRGEIHYGLAVIYADPISPRRSPERARRELAAMEAAGADHPRAREARIISALMDQVEVARAASAAAKSELEALRKEMTALRAELEKKDQELKSIKQVLLQQKP